MKIKDRYSNVIEWFLKNKPVAETELNYKNPFELLVAVILSAQCTDKRVNLITPALFDAYPDAEAMSMASDKDIFHYIQSVTFPNNKSKSLAAMARMLTNQYGGNVPDSMEELIKIPGVGRKTANVILAVIYNRAAMAVDTHVFRVSNRIGLTNDSPNPLKTEQILIKNIPAELIPIAHHWLILHGRYVCKARKPDCMNCGIKEFCKHYKFYG